MPGSLIVTQRDAPQIRIQSGQQITDAPPLRKRTVSWLPVAILVLVACGISIATTAFVMSNTRANNDQTVRTKMQTASRPRAQDVGRSREMDTERLKLKEFDRRLKELDAQLKVRETDISERERAIVERELRALLAKGDGTPEARMPRHEEESGPPKQDKAPGQANPGRLDDETANLLDEHIAVLESDPVPGQRAKAALMLGQSPERASTVVPALQRALVKEVSPQVITAVLRAFASLADDAKPAIPTLVKFINTTKADTHRREAFEALLVIDRTSNDVRTILTKALKGGVGAKPAPGGPPQVLENRKYALEVLIQLGEEAKWSARLLVEVMDVTLDEYINRPDYESGKILEREAKAMLKVEPGGRTSLECLKNARRRLSTNAATERWTTELLVQIDSAIKEMEAAARREAEKK